MAQGTPSFFKLIPGRCSSRQGRICGGQHPIEQIVLDILPRNVADGIAEIEELMDVDGVGEGLQAKRRCLSVIIDHLMPPLTRAESYGPLQDLERQVDEYYDALMVDPRRSKLLRRTILATIVEHALAWERTLPRGDGRPAPSRHATVMH